MSKKKKKKLAIVNRKFMLDLANDIYNPKTRSYLRLCTGTLSNGPDPEDAKRTMHCGLGELYFAITGENPRNVSEADVVHLAIDQSTLKNTEVTKNLLLGYLDQLGLSESVIRETIELSDGEDLAPKGMQEFRELLDGIPDVNDDDPIENSPAHQFRSRAQRVAAQLRKAAALLPE